MTKTAYSVEVPSGTLKKALESVRSGLEELYDAKIDIEERMFLHTENAELAHILKNIFGADTMSTNGSKPKAQKKRRAIPAWTVEETGEKFSTQSLNKRLEKHSLPIGARLHHPKQGHMVIVANQDPDGPDRLVDATEHVSLIEMARAKTAEAGNE